MRVTIAPAVKAGRRRRRMFLGSTLTRLHVAPAELKVPITEDLGRYVSEIYHVTAGNPAAQAVQKIEKPFTPSEFGPSSGPYIRHVPLNSISSSERAETPRSAGAPAQPLDALVHLHFEGSWSFAGGHLAPVGGYRPGEMFGEQSAELNLGMSRQAPDDQHRRQPQSQ